MFFPDIDGELGETAPAPKPLQIARRAARTVPWVMGTLAAGMREQGAGLHPAQVRVLMAMHGGAVGPSELAERMQVSLPTISKTLAVLERHGWLERTADGTDRRRVLVRMTAEGQRRMAAAVHDGVAQLAGVLSAATDAELDDIERGLGSLHEVLSRASAGRGGPRFHGASPHGTARCERPGSKNGGTTE